MQQKTALDTQGQNLNVVHASRLVTHFPVFYGWVIMAIGALGMIMTSPAQTYAISIFIEQFIREMDISRSLVSTLYSAGSLVAGFSLPYIGRQIDRYGSRLMMAVIAVLSGLTCIYMGFVTNAVMLGIGFLVIRIFGHGGLTIVSTNIINQWWVRRRGTVMGISGLLTSILGLGSFPALINWLVPIYGWRATFVILGLMLLLILTPLAFIFARNRPEDYGLQPDGSKPAAPAGGAVETSPVAEEDWTVAEAIRTPTFWIVSLGIAAMAMASTGLFFHMVSIFEDNGLTSSIAATVFVPIAITTAIVTLSSGILVDRLPVQVLFATALVCQGLSLALAPYLYSVTLAFVYGILVGATFGLVRTVGSVIWAMYFGRRHLGSITGVTSTIMVIGASLGPMPFGIGRDLLGSYNTVLLISAIFPFALAVANLFTGRPQKKAL